MYLSGTARMPAEFEFMALDEVLRELPDDIAERALVAVDCANARRIGQDPALLDHAQDRGRRRPPPRQHALRLDAT